MGDGQFALTKLLLAWSHFLSFTLPLIFSHIFHVCIICSKYLFQHRYSFNRKALSLRYILMPGKIAV